MKKLIVTLMLILITILSSCNSEPNLSDEVNYNDPYAYSFYCVFYDLDTYVSSGEKSKINITEENYETYLGREICLEINFFVNGSNYLYNDELDLLVYYSGMNLEILEASTVRENKLESDDEGYESLYEFVFKKIEYAKVMRQQFMLKCVINENIKLHIEAVGSNTLSLLDYSLDFINKQ